MNWKINVIIIFASALLSLLFSFLNLLISASILTLFYLIDLIVPPFYPANVMEKPIVFLSPVLIISITIYILVKLFFSNLIFFILLIILFILDVILSFKRGKN